MKTSVYGTTNFDGDELLDSNEDVVPLDEDARR